MLFLHGAIEPELLASLLVCMKVAFAAGPRRARHWHGLVCAGGLCALAIHIAAFRGEPRSSRRNERPSGRFQCTNSAPRRTEGRI